MLEPIALAHSIAADLSASGFEPRVTRQRGSFRVEVYAPRSLSRDGWHALFAALGRGDDFGHEATTQRAVLWSLVHAKAPPPEADPGDANPSQGSNPT